MSLDEFALIDRYFRARGPIRAEVGLAIGDDAALIDCVPGATLAVTTDTLVAGVHFPTGTSAYDLAWKALAVSLSDLAAMGAEPRWCLLNLTLPTAEEAFLEDFARGFFTLADEAGIALVGGDTTRGPLSVTVTAAGALPVGEALTRSGARPGDRIYVTGFLGEAALGLGVWRGAWSLDPEFLTPVMERFLRPQPRLEFGRSLRGIASSAIDISDGLIGDLGHVLAASGVGARVELARLPLSPAYDAVFAQAGFDLALTGGDDYELLFTAPPKREKALSAVMARMSCPATCIGEITTGAGSRVEDAAGEPYTPTHQSYQHFS